MTSNTSYLNLPRLVKRTAFYFYPEKEAKNVLNLFKGYSRIIFNFPESLPFYVSSNHESFAFLRTEEEKITFNNLMRIYHAVKLAMHHLDVQIIASSYEIDPNEGESSDNIISNEQARLYLSSFFAEGGEFKLLQGSPAICFSYNILHYIFCDKEAEDLPQSNLAIDIKLVKAWINNNHYVVTELKIFIKECIAVVLSSSYPKNTAEHIWKQVRNDKNKMTQS